MQKQNKETRKVDVTPDSFKVCAINLLTNHNNFAIWISEVDQKG